MGNVYRLDAQRRALAERNMLRDRALEQAHALRSAAMDDFFRSAGAWLGQAVDQTRRSTDRLAARLRQHAKLRAAASDARAFEH